MAGLGQAAARRTMLQFLWAVTSFEANAQNYVRGTIVQDSNGLYTGVWPPGGRHVGVGHPQAGVNGRLKVKHGIFNERSILQARLAHPT